MSNFDPFKLYRKSYKQSHHGQVIQQKPIKRMRAYSEQDLNEAKKVLDAYKIPYGIRPDPPAPYQFPTLTISDTFTTTFRTLNLNTKVQFTDTEFYSTFQSTEAYSFLENLSQSYPDQVYKVYVTCSLPLLVLKDVTSYTGISATYTMNFPQIKQIPFTPPSNYPIAAPVGNPATQYIPFSALNDSNVHYSAPLYVGQSTQQTISSVTVNSSKSLMSYKDADMPLSILVTSEGFAARFNNVIFEITRTSNPNVSATFTAALNYNLTVIITPVLSN